MASVCRRGVFQTFQRSISYNFARCYSKQGSVDPMDHATGDEKRELLAAISGNDDIYNTNVVNLLPKSTKDAPNLVPSVFSSRIIGCICEEDATSVMWMWLHKGAPRRCDCGHWFQLVEKSPQ